ncbi:hypothetical protein [Pontibacter fetidus]|uniref:Uncharacterized protein n=1 Tax=Pontibacter fetidus TaxID=2700082 RepID=A0A6B2H5N0_9BACT|nr:hypothetical protein [Pontibacter fetidus]NDK54432.1 hypothetical protein [Pontibacter fetidus]
MANSKYYNGYAIFYDAAQQNNYRLTTYYTTNYSFNVRQHVFIEQAAELV